MFSHYFVLFSACYIFYMFLEYVAGHFYEIESDFLFFGVPFVLAISTVGIVLYRQTYI